MRFLDQVRMLWGRRPMPELPKLESAEELHERIGELLQDNDDLRLQLWTKDEVVRILVEHIAELERD